jgi:hypothetical protein
MDAIAPHLEVAIVGHVMKTRIAPLLFLAAALLGIRPALVAAQDVDHTLNVTLGYGPLFTPDQWIPVHFDFVNRSDSDIDGAGVVPLPYDKKPELRLPAFVPAHSRLRRTAYAYFPPKTPDGIEWSKAPPPGALSMVRWDQHSGARVARTPILGRPAGDSFKDDLETTASGFYLLNFSNSNEGANAYDTMDLASTIVSNAGVPVVTATLIPNDAARSYGGYAAVRVIVLQDFDPDELDPAQRQALLDFVNRGGNLILSSPRPSDNVASGWLGGYLPVQLLGLRRADQITPTGQAPFPFGEYLRATEAMDNGTGEVVLQDQNYVHAAFRRLGLGRVIFTSFPVSALSIKDPRTAQVWQRLLTLAPSATAWGDTGFEAARVDLLQSMLGRSTVSWTAAASVAGGFVLLVLLAQIFIAGAHRPTAFALSVLAAVVLSVVLVALTIGKTRAQELNGARLAVLQVNPNGAGEQREVSAYVGKNDEHFALTVARDGAVVRPIVSGNKPPQIFEHPFAVPNAGVFPLRIEHVWQSSGPTTVDERASALGQFGPEGLNLTVNNQLGQPLAAPLLRWGHVKFSLADIPAGDSQQRPERRNGRDDFTNAAVIRSQTVHLRGDILRALTSPVAGVSSFRAVTPQFEIDGWLDQTTPLLKTSQPLPLRSQSLVRLPIRLQASPVGSLVKIDPAFTRQVLGRSRVSQYDPGRDLWLPTNLDTDMLLGFEAPAEVGQLHPQQVTIDFDVAAPQQTITIRRGQVARGQAVEGGIATGPVVGEWSQPVGRHTATFTATAADYDAQGHLWILVSVASPRSAAGGLIAQWSFRHLEVGFTAEVVGPPVYPFDQPAHARSTAAQDHAAPQPARKAKAKSAVTSRSTSKNQNPKSEDAHAR